MHIGDWDFDTGSELLVRGEETQRLDPVEIAVLQHLHEQAPNLVSSEDLLTRNWPNVVVGDNVVHRVIARLRKALGDDARHPRYIETVPRRGYRLIAELQDTPKSGYPPISAKNCIAVLPFANLNQDLTGASFGDGIAEDILNGLVRSSSIKVIARTSSFQFKDQNVDVRDIGHQLGVTHLLEGSVRVASEHIRVTAQLISAKDGAHLWSEQFDRELTDIFAVQDEITQSVLEALNLYFTPRSKVPTSNPAAYAAYVKARRHTALLQIDEAHAEMQRALALDPDYAEVHAIIASDAQGLVWFRAHSIQDMQNMMGTHNDKALAVDPDLHLARATAAVLKFGVERDFQSGIDMFHAILEEKPQDPLTLSSYAFLLRCLGRFEQLLEIGRVAVSLDPKHPMIQRRLAEDLIWTGYLDEGLRILEYCLKEGLPVAHFLTWIDLLKGNRDSAHARIEDPQAEWDSPDRMLCFKAAMAFEEDDQATLDACLDALESYAGGRREHLPGPEGVRPLNSTIALYRGDIELALDLYETSIEHSFAHFFHAPGLSFPAHFGAALERNRHPAYFQHPRYHEIIRANGLDAASLQKVEVPPLPF